MLKRNIYVRYRTDFPSWPAAVESDGSGTKMPAGERDPIQLSALGLKAVMSEALHASL
jgi:hypothetical protein